VSRANDPFKPVLAHVRVLIPFLWMRWCTFAGPIEVALGLAPATGSIPDASEPRRRESGDREHRYFPGASVSSRFQ
jgi:hypothetical protein